MNGGVDRKVQAFRHVRGSRAVLLARWLLLSELKLICLYPMRLSLLRLRQLVVMQLLETIDPGPDLYTEGVPSRRLC